MLTQITAKQQEELLRLEISQAKQKAGESPLAVDSGCFSNQAPSGVHRLKVLQKRLYSQAEDIQVLINMLPTVPNSEQEHAIEHVANRLGAIYPF